MKINKFKAKIFTLFLMAICITGCSTKSSSSLCNLRPEIWYNYIMADIKANDLKEADKHYNQFASEHVASPLLESTLLVMALANIDEGKYTRANELLDEYIRRYGTKEKIEYAQFLKIKANYDSFQKPNRNQNLMQYSIVEIQNFLNQYPNTQYRPLLETMLIKFKLAVYHLNENIRDLYIQKGRDVSAQIYDEKLQNSALKDANLTAPNLPWYRAFFE